MEVYVEVTYVMNAFLILLSLELLCYLLNIQMMKKEVLKYVFLLNCSLFLLYIDMFCGFILIYDFIIFFFKVLEIICAIMPPMIITVSDLNQPGVDVFANLTERELRFSY